MSVKTNSNSEKQQDPEKKLINRVQETLRLKHYSYRKDVCTSYLQFYSFSQQTKSHGFEGK